jgi:hypothetical protein
MEIKMRSVYPIIAKIETSPRLGTILSLIDPLDTVANVFKDLCQARSEPLISRSLRYFKFFAGYT